ncbi:MAG: hypothetical protein DI551_12290 [Micavibrio aeruginosavorus]|uniref:Uncharacterized protein n=1 Tax=Micavibrio aeruginosavorus TaxID=349221 RepID=A0A2W5MRJ2_9BACT|nr:MAG: hypothetical protein DI551_12290 [Micavibrio aeruginosavorus]
MKQSIGTIVASEDRGSLIDNVKSKNLQRLSTLLCAPIFLCASSAQANTASMSIIRDVETPAQTTQELVKLEQQLQSQHNKLSYTRQGDIYSVTLR